MVSASDSVKRAMLFRVDEPFDKISTPGVRAADGRTRRKSVRASRLCPRHPSNTHAPTLGEAENRGRN